MLLHLIQEEASTKLYSEFASIPTPAKKEETQQKFKFTL